MILENIKRVLIIRCGALGETIFALPVVEALRKQYGEDIEIDWVGTPAASALFKLDPRIHKIFHLKHRKLPILFSFEKKAIIKYSKKNPYDLLINLESGHIFYPLVEKIAATHKFGMPYNQIRAMPNPHAIDSLKTMYEKIVDSQIMENSYPLLFGEEPSLVQKKFNLPEHYIVINASTSHYRKFTHRAWPSNYWKELITSLAPNYHVVIIGGKGEDKFFDSLLPYPPSVIDTVGKSTLPELITIIRNAEAIITADTGPSHIASAVNTRTFALFGPSNHKGTGPYITPFNHVHIISKNLECSPCNATNRIKLCKDNQCMKQILPIEVLTAIQPYVTSKNEL
jgi:ADP-heptose:LPS heptosyltransferase